MALPTDDVLENWNHIMRYQVDFSFPLELPMYLSHSSWCTADRVLDLGSGDGYYVRRLATYFPNKSYTCIDIDERAIDAGRTQSTTPDPNAVNSTKYQIDFRTDDILTCRGNFPFAIARLLVQHLDSPQDLFVAAPHFLRNGGVLVVIDSDDRTRLFWPKEKFRRIDEFFEKFHEYQPGRSHGETMMKIASSHGFEVQTYQVLTIPSSLPTFKEIFYKSYQLFFEIVKKHYNMDFDYESLASELRTWSQDRGSYSQIGVSVGIYRWCR